jgi:hypothetical protein
MDAFSYGHVTVLCVSADIIGEIVDVLLLRVI